MSFLEFIIALVVIRYVYKIINSKTVNEESLKKIVLNEFKPYLKNLNKEYKEWNDQFLTSVIDANGDINKIIEAAKVIDDKFKERENEIMDYQIDNKWKQKKSN